MHVTKCKNNIFLRSDINLIDFCIKKWWLNVLFCHKYVIYIYNNI